MYTRLKNWMYHDNRPNWAARLLNGFWQMVHSSRFLSDRWVTLEVIGRKSGHIIAFPVVLASLDGEHYIVSMLGNDANWVHNVRAANGKAYIRSGKRREVSLEEVPADQRAPILKNYLQRAPGARPHIPIDKEANIHEFETIAAEFPAFRIVST